VGYEPTPARVKELIRRCALTVADADPDWLEELDRATLRANAAISEDPAQAALASAANRANLMHWAACNIRDPGGAVPAYDGPEPRAIARELLQRGLDPVAPASYRAGEAVVWQRLLGIVFDMTTDAAELQAVLATCVRSVTGFVDATLAAIGTEMELERVELMRGTRATHREVIGRLIDGAPMSAALATVRLGYPVEGDHTAAILWTTKSDDATARHLDAAANAVRAAANSPTYLSISAGATTRWIWVAGSGIDIHQLRGALDQGEGVRVAVGSPASGAEGFRTSHLDAVLAQHVLAASSQSVANYHEVRLTSLIVRDRQQAGEFITRVLGDLEYADADLRATVLAFVNQLGNASHASEQLYTHRNTVLRRLARADRLLPRPLRENPVEVAVALDALAWRRPQ
jgi:DNA-binding PucR family transcriptional regulator